METYSTQLKLKHCCNLLALLLFVALVNSFPIGETHYFEFNVQQTPVKRLCRTRNTITINGQYPGPTLTVRNGDSLVVEVINNARYNARSPIRPGNSYTYRFTIQNQEGTLWWHAHSKWLRATVHGALVIQPRLGSVYPFPAPTRELPIILGEWWDRNPMDVLKLALFTGAAANASNAFTINGQPGDLYRCSKKETLRIPVESGETILLRIINAALNGELFFPVANHRLTVVGADASYTKPFTTNVIQMGPGQTTNVLLRADQPPALYYMAARAYASGQNVPFDNTTTTAIFAYKSATPNGGGAYQRPILPVLPAFNDTNTVTAFRDQFRSLSNQVNVPKQIDENLLFTVGVGLFNCTVPNSPRCQGPNGTRLSASMNNVSFVLPSRNSILQAFYQRSLGVYTANFPPVPPVPFNYTGNVPRALWQPMRGTEVYRLKYGTNVQIVLRDTAIVTTEEHPMHLHGYNFFVVATGFGNFNPATDTAKFNLVDPPSRNTIGVPVGGWAVIRFTADNPGAWLMHCHLDIHFKLGLSNDFPRRQRSRSIAIYHSSATRFAPVLGATLLIRHHLGIDFNLEENKPTFVASSTFYYQIVSFSL